MHLEYLTPKMKVYFWTWMWLNIVIQVQKYVFLIQHTGHNFQTIWKWLIFKLAKKLNLVSRHSAFSILSYFFIKLDLFGTWSTLKVLYSIAYLKNERLKIVNCGSEMKKLNFWTKSTIFVTFESKKELFSFWVEIQQRHYLT